MYQHQHSMDENLDSLPTRHVPLWFCRLLVAILVLSFVTFLATLWLSGTLTTLPEQWSSINLFQVLGAHRLPVLVFPVVCMIVCYFALRHLTGEVLAVPERYLDERQKMVRDQAHRSAFKLIKASCVLVPLSFVLVNIASWLPSAPAPAFASMPSIVVAFDARSLQGSLVPWVITSHSLSSSTFTFYTQLIPTIPSPTPVEIILAACLLLLSLFLAASALPMFVLAWKGKM